MALREILKGGGEGAYFPHFFKRKFFFFFWRNKFEADWETRIAAVLEGSVGMLFRNFFENSRAVMAIFVLFE